MKSTERNILETFQVIRNHKTILKEFIEPAVSTKMIMPVPISKNLKSNFGQIRGDEVHPGVDIPVPSGTPVKAPANGKVITADLTSNRICGGTIDIDYGNNLWSRFCHLKRIDVKKGDIVKQGQVVGLTGGGKGEIGQGRSQGPHLHMALLQGNKKLDPLQFLDKNVEIVSQDSKTSTDSDIESTPDLSPLFKIKNSDSSELTDLKQKIDTINFFKDKNWMKDFFK